MSAMDSDSDSGEIPARYPIKGYALSGKIMLSAIVILFTVVVLMVCLHLYARWYLLRARRSRRRTHLVFYVEPGSTGTVPTRGIDASLLKSLPTFVYSSKTHPDVLECAVCLSEFEENEKGRLLPKCNHNFHINCIDMWFHSHSTCPLCRSPVDQEVSGPVPENRDEVVVSVGEPAETEAGSSSGLCPTCQHDEGDVGQGRSSSSVGSSSLGARRKPMELVGVTIEVPRRNESFGRSEEELGLSSPAGQVLRSLRRILSRDRRVGLSPSSGASSGVAMGCGSVTESDIERGLEGDETQRTRAR